MAICNDHCHSFYDQLNLHFIHKKGGIMKSREYIKAEENFKIEQEKRFQREDRRQQVEQLTLLKDKKKPKGTYPKSK